MTNQLLARLAILLLGVMAFLCTPTPARAIDTATNPANNSEYFLTDLTTWTEAEAQAEAAGGYLVAINNAAEQEWLVETFGGTDAFWIGLSDANSEGEFEWASGEPVTYTNWAEGEPDNREKQNFVWINYTRPGLWDDASGIQLQGIAEIAPSSPQADAETESLDSRRDRFSDFFSEDDRVRIQEFIKKFRQS